MSLTQRLSDQFAIGLSAVCAIHCVVLPVLMVMLPSLASLPLQNEAFHLWMVIIVVPTSVYALFMGCKQHKRYRLLVFGLVGIALLVSAVVIGEETLGIWEKVITLTGAMILATGHYLNFRECRKHSHCEHNHCSST